MAARQSRLGNAGLPAPDQGRCVPRTSPGTILVLADNVVSGTFLSPHCIIAVTDWLNTRADSLANA